MKTKIIFLIITFSLITLGFAGCLDENETGNNDTDPLEGLEYQNTEYGFGLNPPKNWTLDEDDSYGVVRFYGPIIDEYQLNIGITEPADLGGEDFETAVESLKQYYETIFPNYTLLNMNPTTINSMNAYEIVHTYNITDVVELKIKQKQVLIEKDSMVYTITFSASVDSYQTYISIVDESINSFKIK